MRSRSPSSAMSKMYEDYRGSLEEYVSSTKPKEGQVGMAVVIGGDLSGIDIFDREKTLGRYWEKLIRSHGLDAIEWQSHNLRKCEMGAIQEILSALEADMLKEFEPVSRFGRDIRISGRGLIGSALVADHTVVHAMVFKSPEGRG